MQECLNVWRITNKISLARGANRLLEDYVRNYNDTARQAAVRDAYGFFNCRQRQRMRKLGIAIRHMGDSHAACYTGYYVSPAEQGTTFLIVSPENFEKMPESSEFYDLEWEHIQETDTEEPCGLHIYDDTV